MVIYLSNGASHLKPTSLVLNDLELVPYQYREYLDSNDSLAIVARVILSEELYSNLGKLPEYVQVIRRGIDEKPREMELIETHWSKAGDEIKEQIRLYDKEEVPELPVLGWVFGEATEVAIQSLILNGLVDILISNGVLEKEKLDEMKAKITEQKIWDKKREFNRLKIDLDRFASIERDD